MQEPGLDEHEWTTRFGALEDDIRSSPAESLSDLDDLVAEMMVARGLPLAERDGEEVLEPEIVRQFEESRRVTRQLDTGEPYDPGDVASAVEGYLTLYEDLLGRE
jgi:hypothetical protein